MSLVSQYNFSEIPSSIDTVKLQEWNSWSGRIIEINPSIRPNSVENKNHLAEAKEQLNAIYQGVIKDLKDPQNLQLLVKIFLKYGKILNEESRPSSLGFFRASLNTTLYQLKLIDQLYFEIKPTLAGFENIFADPSSSPAFDEMIFSTDPQALMQKIPESYPLILTETGMAAMHFTNELIKKITPTTNHFNLYRFSEALLQNGTKIGKLELAELYFNGFSRLELLLNPSDLTKAHTWLDQALQHNPSPQMQVRVANLKSCDFEKIEHFAIAKIFLDKALLIQNNETSPNERDPFEVANLWLRRSNLQLQDSEKNDYFTLICVKKCIEYSDSCRSSRNWEDQLVDHEHNQLQFGVYDLHMAQALMDNFDIDGSLKYCRRAIETFTHFDSKEHLAKAGELKKSLIRVTTAGKKETL